MSSPCVIVDANIAFKALISGRGDLRGRIASHSTPHLFAPRALFIELFKHKDRLLHASALSESDLLAALYSLTTAIDFQNEADLSAQAWLEGYRLCRGIDPADTPYVALTLHLDGLLWTDDEVLREGLSGRGFSRFYNPFASR